MRRLDQLRTALEQQLEAVRDGLRILTEILAEILPGIAQPGEIAVAAEPVRVPCPFCGQLVTPGATVCGCRRRPSASP